MEELSSLNLRYLNGFIILIFDKICIRNQEFAREPIMSVLVCQN